MKTIITILLALSLSVASPYFRVDSKVNEFIQDSPKNFIRTGQIGKASTAAVIEWPPSVTYSESISITGVQLYLLHLIQSVCPGSQYTVYGDETTKTIATSLNVVPPITPIGSNDSAKFKNLLYTRILSKIPARLETEVHAISFEYQNDSIAGAIIRLRRIFKNGILADNISYISIVTDTKGTITSIDAVWPDFTENVGIGEMISRDSAKAVLYSVLADKYSIAVGATRMTAEGYSITSATNAWQYVEYNNQKILSPAYSFTVNVEFDNGKTDYLILTIPLLKALYK